MQKTAVICPGIGYCKDRPLLYCASQIAQNCGFEIVNIEYHDMPQKIRGNMKMMRQAAVLAYQQTAEQLADAGITGEGELLLIGKSIGTIAAAKYAKDHALNAKQIWYTPLEATFQFAPADSCIAFIGTADPWSDVSNIETLASSANIPLAVYEGCNHSLESKDVLRNIEILRDVMQKTACFL